MTTNHGPDAGGSSRLPSERHALGPGHTRKLLLTSAGIRNEVLRSALADLVGKPFGRATVAFVPTAALAAPGHHGWLIEHVNRLYGLGWREFSVVELNGLAGEVVLRRLRRADVIYAEGGNHYHLARSIIANGLAAEMAAIIESKVYVGVSAGSMIFSRNLSEQTGRAFAEHDDLQILGDQPACSPFGLFDWYVKPHLNSPVFRNRTPAWFERACANLDFPVYALDDESAVRVRGDEVDVVSGGQWLLLNAPAPGAGSAPRAGHAPAPAGALPGIRAMAWSAVIDHPRVYRMLSSARRRIQPRK
ncbi:MAG TPA: Type 1 glutamine amidotransferase-like domain-containing protein [Trebonia sp.]|nr:Type 1 glutamine amidotransferase-like domain-containing protein [Trebonia sp.]